LLIDIGSTTTDIIPLADGVPCAQGHSDLGRLRSGELVYTGVRRTPLCALTAAVSLRGATCSLAAELFATTLDLYLITGWIENSPDDCDTADGRPATVEHAFDRLAHMLCCDRTELTIDELQSISRELFNQQLQIIRTAVERVISRSSPPVTTAILSGSGAFLARQVIDSIPSLLPARRIDLGAELSADLAEAACAHAVATLLSETIHR
jgi:(4-(4-[2-(gamma-L-glutamylamino)ethyl]phenoxymethyl)furan-2-yl)methanamine synthase